MRYQALRTSGSQVIRFEATRGAAPTVGSARVEHLKRVVEIVAEPCGRYATSGNRGRDDAMGCEETHGGAADRLSSITFFGVQIVGVGRGGERWLIGVGRGGRRGASGWGEAVGVVHRGGERRAEVVQRADPMLTHGAQTALLEVNDVGLRAA
jgi:hypothetical protein